MTCQACETARAYSKAAGHRDWRRGVCFDHAAVSLDDVWARLGYVPDERMVALELAKMNAAHAARHQAASPVQQDLFGAAA